MILVDAALGLQEREICSYLSVLYTDIQEILPLSPCIWKFLVEFYVIAGSLSMLYIFLLNDGKS